MGRRRQGRESALQALYLIDVAGSGEEEAFAAAKPGIGLEDPGTLLFARELVEGTVKHRSAIDKHIEVAAENWTLKRMTAVDRCVLRLAFYELLYHPKTPINVVIDEAIEIARKYATEESTGFVNGILDKLKSHRPAAASESPAA